MGAYLSLSMNEAVKVGGLTLPGVVTDVQVGGRLNIDEQDLENTNLKTAAVLGYTTQTVSVSLTITGGSQSDVDAQVARIQKAFQVDRVKTSGAKLVPVRIVSPHLDARRVKVVVFDAFDSRETDDLEVTCTLQFHEFESDVARMQQRIAAEEKRRADAAKEAAERAKGKGKGKGKGGKDGEGGSSGGGPDGTPTPPGGGKGAAGGTSPGSSAGGTPAILRGFTAGSGDVRSLLGAP